MIKQLRHRFIAITMVSVLVVLGGILAIINAVNYYHIRQNADTVLHVIEENGGTYPMKKKVGTRKISGYYKDSPEAPFDTRYFTVIFDGDGNTVSTDTSRIAAVSAGEAEEYARALLEGGHTSGFRENFRYRAVVTEARTMYLFLDCSKELSTFYSFLAASILIGLGGLLLVFVLVLFFSKLAVRPISRTMEQQKRFITDASHEIKTPLTIIDANTEVLEMEGGENDWTRSIKKQVHRLSEMTERLIFLTRMEEKPSRLVFTNFPLSDAVAEESEAFLSLAQALGKDFRLDIEPKLTYHGDEQAIRRLVSLLLDNAMKYSDDRGMIVLTLNASGKNKVLTVWNTTHEVPRGNLKRLFERFYRLDASHNSETGGYGIGLSTARAIVEAHGGKISAKSLDGRSVRFTAIL